MWKTLCIILYTSFAAGVEKNWEYTVISVFSNSSDEDQLKTDFKVERVKRGEYAVSGTGTSRITTDNDLFTMALDTYRSASGVGEYTKLPFSFPKQTFPKFMNSSYKQYIMNSIKDCSNLPQFDGDYVGPFPPDDYYLKSCLIDTDDLPLFLHPGYYKVVLNMGGPVSMYAECLLQIKSKN